MIKWVSKKDWFDAIKARKSGTATKKQQIYQTKDTIGKEEKSNERIRFISRL